MFVDVQGIRLLRKVICSNDSPSLRIFIFSISEKQLRKGHKKPGGISERTRHRHSCPSTRLSLPSSLPVLPPLEVASSSSHRPC